MRSQILRSRTACLLFFLLGISAACFAIDERYGAEPLKGSSGQIKKDSTITVEDTVHFRPLLKPFQTTNNVRNIVTFKIDEFTRLLLPTTFSVKLKVKVYYVKEAIVSGVLTDVNDSTALIELVLNYNRNSFYQSKAAYTFTGGYRAEVKIFDVEVLSGTLSDFEGALMLENEILVNREFRFVCDSNVVTTVSKDTSAISTQGEMKVSWPKERAADEYDLEWTYIDQSAYSNYYFSATSNFDPAKVFANATRVSVKAEEYYIPLLYDNTGKLFFRVRPVQVKRSGQRKEANWSSGYMGGLGEYAFNGHERALNWQATTSFAEEGKRKSVVQYFDGSLRSRQTVTKDNTTNTTIVAETFYDFQGRPAIQVLPAPTLDNIIKYTPNFNVALNGAEFEKSLYDGLLASGQYCDSTAAEMDTVSGASKYYSANNPLKDSGFHRFIPNANKYPFAQTRYTQDNTGRISVQGGVGKGFQIGRTDLDLTTHDTRYYYSSADPAEIDALFGSEVGNASHYFKNMVRDANGQYSISYVDMHGRTVATALAGTPKAKLDSLSYKSTQLITKKLLDTANNIVKGTVIESSKSLVVTKPDSVRFVYTLQPDSISIMACNSTTLCYECLYDLEITITDEECNNDKLGGNPYKITKKSLSLNNAPPYDTACNAVDTFPGIDQKVYLPEGTYLITKRLVINQRAFDFYRDSVFMRRNTCKTLEDFIKDELDLLRSKIQCQPTCQACLDSLKTWSQFQADYMEHAGISPADSANYRARALKAYEEKKAECDELCNGTALHHSIRQQMIADVTPPYGQYAKLNYKEPFSVFFKPFLLRYRYQTVGYTDFDGKPDTILNSNNQLWPPYSPNITPEEFVQNFKESWTDSLLTLHPEYCKLQKFESLATSNSWDERFQRTDTYQEAVDSGFLNPANFLTDVPSGSIFAHNSAHKDPFFTDYLGTKVPTAYKGYMLDSMKRKWYDGGAVSAWALATIMAKCPEGDNSCFTANKTNDSAFHISAACAGDLDIAWRYFREMYLQEKRELVYKLLQESCLSDPAIPTPFYTLRFPNPDITTADVPADTAAGRDSLNAFIEYNCQAYAMQWWNELKLCSFTTEDTAWIFPKLRQVCMEGSDSAHLFGSSTVKPSSTYSYRSFDDVLAEYRAVSGRSLDSCNGYMITAPKPYDKQPTYYDKPIFTKPDSCECAKISEYYNDYQTFGRADANFSDYLYRVTGVRMYNGVLDTLRMACNGAIDCRFLKDPVTLPPILQCEAQPGCASCDNIKSLYRRYEELFPTHLPQMNDTDSAQRFSNRLFENFMNSELGFSNVHADYLAFMQQCDNVKPAICSNLDSLQKAFRQVGPYIEHVMIPYETGEHIYDPQRFFIDGIVRVPHPSRLQPAGFYTNYGATLQNASWCFTDSGYSFEWRFKYPQNGYNHNTYYISRGNLGFIFGQFINVPYGGGTLNGVYLWGHSDDESRYTGAHYGGVGFDYIYAGPASSIEDWHIVRITAKMNAYDVYYNGSLVTSLPRVDSNSLHPRRTDFGAHFLGNDPQIDWFKIYDRFGNIMYQEDYNNPSNPSRPNPAGLCTSWDCETQFASFFNTAKGTSYTFSQIDSIYKVCGTPLIVCTNDTLTCDSLSAIYNNAVTAFAAVPDSLATADSCTHFFENYFNLHTGLDFNYAQIKNYYIQRCGHSISLCTPDTLLLCGRTQSAFPPIKWTQHTTCSDTTLFAKVKGMQLYNIYRDSLLNSFNDRYLAKCLSARYHESFTAELPVSEYHYTLYYYDQAGNLVKTIPPAGVDISKFSHTKSWSDSVDLARYNKQLLVPDHKLPTHYRYNTLNQVVAQRSPDGGKTEFWYDRLGRLVISRNGKQLAESTGDNKYYSYTKYDVLGRITEVGQINDTVSGRAMTDALTRSQTDLNNWLLGLTANREQITETIYDVAYDGFTGMDPKLVMVQRNLRNRVSYTTYTDGNNTSRFNTATFFSYDIHGNVDTLLQDYGISTYAPNLMNKNNMRWKKLVYQYDLISGKVNHVAYNPRQLDELYHRYSYDAENRLTLVETSTDSIIWERDARYEYYRHGPLARTVLGNELVQGIDYAYTLQGWLKGVNSISLDSTLDMGRDAMPGTLNKYVTKDAVGFNLNYFSGDYSAISGANPFPGHSAYLPGGEYRPLYNGNISSMAVNIAQLARPQLYNYRYDQLNRLTGMDAYTGLSGNSWAGLTDSTYYRERIAYDANGNILNYLRNGDKRFVETMDSLHYQYYPNTNRLGRVRDNVGEFAYFQIDVEDQGAGDNYTYDSIGNMITDAKENITNIKWNVYGKIKEITRTGDASNPYFAIYQIITKYISKSLQKKCNFNLP